MKYAIRTATGMHRNFLFLADLAVIILNGFDYVFNGWQFFKSTNKMSVWAKGRNNRLKNRQLKNDVFDCVMCNRCGRHVFFISSQKEVKNSITKMTQKS